MSGLTRTAVSAYFRERVNRRSLVAAALAGFGLGLLALALATFDAPNAPATALAWGAGLAIAAAVGGYRLNRKAGFGKALLRGLLRGFEGTIGFAFLIASALLLAPYFGDNADVERNLIPLFAGGIASIGVAEVVREPDPGRRREVVFGNIVWAAIFGGLVALAAGGSWGILAAVALPLGMIGLVVMTMRERESRVRPTAR